jgi:hypothetical protein
MDTLVCFCISLSLLNSSNLICELFRTVIECKLEMTETVSISYYQIEVGVMVRA